MAGESKNDKYIICSKCKCNYINDEEHISTDLGYTRLEERHKTSDKCRKHSILINNTWYDNHKEELKQYSNTYRE